MTLGLMFWISMFITLLFGGWWSWTPANRPAAGGIGLAFFLFFLLGWQVFGAPIRG